MANALTDLLSGNLQGFAENMGDALQNPGRVLKQGPQGPQVSLSLLLDSDARNAAEKERKAALKAAEQQANLEAYHKLMQIQDSVLGKDPTLERQQEKMANVNAQLAGTGMSQFMQRRDFAPEIAQRNAAREELVGQGLVGPALSKYLTHEKMPGVAAGMTTATHQQREVRRTQQQQADTTRKLETWRQEQADIQRDKDQNRRGGREDQLLGSLYHNLGTNPQAEAAISVVTDMPRGPERSSALAKLVEAAPALASGQVGAKDARNLLNIYSDVVGGTAGKIGKATAEGGDDGQVASALDHLSTNFLKPATTPAEKDRSRFEAASHVLAGMTNIPADLDEQVKLLPGTPSQAHVDLLNEIRKRKAAEVGRKGGEDDRFFTTVGTAERFLNSLDWTQYSVEGRQRLDAVNAAPATPEDEAALNRAKIQLANDLAGRAIGLAPVDQEELEAKERALGDMLHLRPGVTDPYGPELRQSAGAALVSGRIDLIDGAMSDLRAVAKGRAPEPMDPEALTPQAAQDILRDFSMNEGLMKTLTPEWRAVVEASIQPGAAPSATGVMAAKKMLEEADLKVPPPDFSTTTLSRLQDNIIKSREAKSSLEALRELRDVIPEEVFKETFTLGGKLRGRLEHWAKRFGRGGDREDPTKAQQIHHAQALVRTVAGDSLQKYVYSISGTATAEQQFNELKQIWPYDEKDDWDEFWIKTNGMIWTLGRAEKLAEDQVDALMAGDPLMRTRATQGLHAVYNRGLSLVNENLDRRASRDSAADAPASVEELIDLRRRGAITDEELRYHLGGTGLQ